VATSTSITITILTGITLTTAETTSITDPDKVTDPAKAAVSGSITHNTAVMLPMEIEERLISSVAERKDNSDQAPAIGQVVIKAWLVTDPVAAERPIDPVAERPIDPVAEQPKDLVGDRPIGLVAGRTPGPEAAVAGNLARCPQTAAGGIKLVTAP
jgi:hypothetical protein